LPHSPVPLKQVHWLALPGEPQMSPGAHPFGLAMGSHCSPGSLVPLPQVEPPPVHSQTQLWPAPHAGVHSPTHSLPEASAQVHSFAVPAARQASPVAQPVGVAAGSHSSPASTVPSPQTASPASMQVQASGVPGPRHCSSTSQPVGLATGSQSSSSWITPSPQSSVSCGNWTLAIACTAAACVRPMHRFRSARVKVSLGVASAQVASKPMPTRPASEHAARPR
jgi:hypothetical protein